MHDPRKVLLPLGLAALGIGLVAMTASFVRPRMGRKRRRTLRLAVLNPRDKSDYNSRIMEMLAELFEAAGVAVELTEFDVSSGSDEAKAARAEFDGFIIPGSMASAYDDSIPWLGSLADLIRALDAERRPTLGICFGHQIIAQALGGEVILNPAGAHAGAVTFNPSPKGQELLGLGGETTLLYHHYDIVHRLPPSGVNLGFSVSNPVHAAAIGDGKGGVHMISFQAHPEFSTPLGRQVLGTIISKKDAPKFGEAWASAKAATMGTEGNDPVRVTQAAVRALWPAAV